MKFDDFALAATTNDLTRETDARGHADVIEFRMDKADDPIEQLSNYDGKLPIIATNRNIWFGGKAQDTGRLDDLFAASKYDAVEAVDIELETARSKEWVLREFRQNDVQLIISHHSFDETPDQEVLEAIIEQCDEYGDVAKVATFAQDQRDTLTLFGALYESTQKDIDVIGISMGEVGRHTRIVGHLYGSRGGYAPLQSDKSDYAPGQIPLEQLSSLIESTKANGANVEQLDELDGSVATP